MVHIRLQQRNTRKTITTIQGLDDKNDLGRLVQHFKKVSQLMISNSYLLLQIFQCNGTVIDHPEYGKVIQLAGDQRQLVKDFLVKVGIVSEEQCKMHGF